MWLPSVKRIPGVLFSRTRSCHARCTGMHTDTRIHACIAARLYLRFNRDIYTWFIFREEEHLAGSQSLALNAVTERIFTPTTIPLFCSLSSRQYSALSRENESQTDFLSNALSFPEHEGKHTLEKFARNNRAHCESLHWKYTRACNFSPLCQVVFQKFALIKSPDFLINYFFTFWFSINFFARTLDFWQLELPFRVELPFSLRSCTSRHSFLILT